MKKKHPSLEKTAFLEFIKQTHRKDIDSVTADQKISRFDWRLKTHVFNIDPKSGHVSSFVKMLSQFEDKEIKDMVKFTERLDKIFSAAKAKNVEVLGDAEQTYIQYMIDSVTEQFSLK